DFEKILFYNAPPLQRAHLGAPGFRYPLGRAVANPYLCRLVVQITAFEEMSIRPWQTVENLDSAARRLPQPDLGGFACRKGFGDRNREHLQHPMWAVTRRFTPTPVLGPKRLRHPSDVIDDRR